MLPEMIANLGIIGIIKDIILVAFTAGLFWGSWKTTKDKLKVLESTLTEIIKTDYCTKDDVEKMVDSKLSAKTEIIYTKLEALNEIVTTKIDGLSKTISDFKQSMVEFKQYIATQFSKTEAKN